jgi:hypothetical protein
LCPSSQDNGQKAKVFGKLVVGSFMFKAFSLTPWRISTDLNPPNTSCAIEVEEPAKVGASPLFHVKVEAQVDLLRSQAQKMDFS